MANGGFAKVVVRNVAEGHHQHQSNVPSRSLHDVASAASEMLQRRQQATESVNHRSGSGLTPAEVGLTLAVLFGLFIILVVIGELCRIFNRPRKEAAPYVKQKPYQPSAAGYGTRSATSGGQKQEPRQFGSRVSLLAAASPMGYTGSVGEDTTADTSLETPSAGSHNQGDYFGSAKQNGHTRGQSSGIQLPGATIASSRKTGGAHPAMISGATSMFSPDGGNFTPGQPVSYAGYAGPPSTVPKGPGGAPAANVPAHARVGMGRPPASDGRRRSRYSRATSRRIDSMGPGQMRKSLYLGADDDPMNAELYPPSQNRRSRVVRKVSNDERQEGGGLRRVDSVGKGDARRKSIVQSTHRASRAVSIYNAGQPAVNGGAMPSGYPAGQAGNPTAGRSDPLGARRDHGQVANGSYLTPNARSSSNPRSRSGSGSSNGRGGGSSADMPYARSPASSASPLPSPTYPQSGSDYMQAGKGYPQGPSYGSSPTSAGGSGGGFRPGALMPSNVANGYAAQPSSTQQPPMGYAGGGAPRMRPSNQGFNAYTSPVQAAGGYDRGARQIL